MTQPYDEAALTLCQATGAIESSPGSGVSHGLAHSGCDYRHRHRNHGRNHDMVRRAIQEVDRVLDLPTLLPYRAMVVAVCSEHG